MKLLLILMFLLFVCTLFSQPVGRTAPGRANAASAPMSFNIYGYINGVRLDSLNASYATFNWRSNREMVMFDYGQDKVANTNLILTDLKGIPLVFALRSSSFVLNFFHYNHWEFVNTYLNNGDTWWILKKQ